MELILYVVTATADGTQTWYLVEDLFGRDIHGNKEVMLRLRLSPLDAATTYKSYKVA